MSKMSDLKSEVKLERVLSLANIPSLKEVSELKERLDDVEKNMLLTEERLISLIEKLEEKKNS